MVKYNFKINGKNENLSKIYWGEVGRGEKYFSFSFLFHWLTNIGTL
jgi:hypothetical protein